MSGEVDLDGQPSPVEAIVVAAGSSSRMGGQDKLDAELRGRSVLRWSIEALAAGGVDRIVVVAAPTRVTALAGASWLPHQVVAVVRGGARRQESVAAGVAALAGSNVPGGTVDPVILVHDGARPLVSPGLVRAVASATALHGAAIPVLPVAETLKRLVGDRVGETVDRVDVAAAQTPQGARLSLLERAYAAYPPDGPETWTDEAALLEACRIPVHAISGEPTNLKVTVPVDLDRARALLDAGLVPGQTPLSGPASSPNVAGSSVARSSGRVGLGLDGHPFGPGEPLVLGGIRIEGAPRLVGHSDGDAALHAVADALLGAAGLGDLGRLHPADERTPCGVDSSLLLADVAARVRDAGWRISNVDLTIVAARPRLGPRLPEMEKAIAAALSIPAESVNVKASTGNLGGPEGAGRAISASAIAWLVPEERGSGR